MTDVSETRFPPPVDLELEGSIRLTWFAIGVQSDVAVVERLEVQHVAHRGAGSERASILGGEGVRVDASQARSGLVPELSDELTSELVIPIGDDRCDLALELGDVGLLNHAAVDPDEEQRAGTEPSP